MAANFSPLLQHCPAAAFRNRVAAPALTSAPPTRDQAPRHLAPAAHPQVLPAPAYLEPQGSKAQPTVLLLHRAESKENLHLPAVTHDAWEPCQLATPKEDPHLPAVTQDAMELCQLATPKKGLRPPAATAAQMQQNGPDQLQPPQLPARLQQPQHPPPQPQRPLVPPPQPEPQPQVHTAADFSPLLQHYLARASENRVAAPALASAPPTKVQTARNRVATQPQVLPAPAYLEPQGSKAQLTALLHHCTESKEDLRPLAVTKDAREPRQLTMPKEGLRPLAATAAQMQQISPDQLQPLQLPAQPQCSPPQPRQHQPQVHIAADYSLLLRHRPAKASGNGRLTAPKRLALAAQPQVPPAPAYPEPQGSRAQRTALSTATEDAREPQQNGPD